VIAIRGNVDTDHWAEGYPDTKMVRLGGRSIYVLHDIHELRLDPVSCGVDVVISRPLASAPAACSILIQEAPGLGVLTCPSLWRYFPLFARA
jgi:hypothetical protein